MNRRKLSWQWQIVLIMGTVSGLALAGFILVFWNSVVNSSYKRFDAELNTVSMREGFPYLAMFRPERPPVPPSGDRDGPVATGDDAFGFYNLETSRGEVSQVWPEGLAMREIAERVVARYAELGMELPDPPPPGRFSRRPPTGDWALAGPRHPAPLPPAQPVQLLEEAVFDTVEFSGERWRLLGFSDGTRVFMALRNYQPLDAEMADLRRSILLALPVALLLIGIVAWWLAGRAVVPVRRLTRSASEVSAKDLSQRIEPGTEPPEFAELIYVYNRMLDRLERSFGQARRFSADAAHELNTPVAILKGHLDNMLQSGGDNPGGQRQLVLLLEEVERLQDILGKLLLLSQADSGRLPVDASRFDLSALVCDILEDARLVTPDLAFAPDIAKAIHFTGDPALLRQCIFNLFSNAMKYNRPNGRIEISLRELADCIQLNITNTGPPIPEDQVGKLFDRFFRAGNSIGSKVKGRGLGLSLAREFARAHRGSIDLVSNKEDAINFRLQLPKG